MFLERYVRLAYDVNQRGLVFFNMTPKMHYLDHIHVELRAQLRNSRVLNPMAFSTAMAEDHVGRSSVMSRTTHQVSMPSRTAQKWLIETRLRWKKDR